MYAKSISKQWFDAQILVKKSEITNYYSGFMIFVVILLEMW